MVRLSIDERPMKCRGVRLEISGAAKVQWEGDHDGQETYVGHRTYLTGGSKEAMTLPVGELKVVEIDPWPIINNHGSTTS